MKKALFFLAACCVLYVRAYAQTNIFESAGNVGIGTISPAYKLHVKGGGDFQLKTESSTWFSGLIMNSSTTTKQLGILFGSDGASAHNTNDVRFGRYSSPTATWEANPVLFDLDAPDGSLTLSDQGKVGIGTLSPAESLTIAGTNGNIFIGNSLFTGYNGVWLNGSTDALKYNFLSSVSDNNLYINRPVGAGILFRQENNDQMIIAYNGNVGIGTSTPLEKLAVNGTVLSKKVKVTQTGWADYVFNPSYRLAPLYEVEAYIKLHRHLPEIPSAAEVEKNGLDLGDNQSALLKKVEELTLYAIQQQKEIDDLKSENQSLRSIREEIARIKEVLKIN